MVASKHIKKYTLYPILLICILSCQKVYDILVTDFNNLDCENLKTGIINRDIDIVKSEIHKITVLLKPRVSESDQFGHKENLNILIEQLNIQCDSLSAELGCYACLYSLPPQSIIKISTDSSGTEIDRIIYIRTPEDDILSCSSIY